MTADMAPPNELGVIRNFKIGMVDRNEPCAVFDVYTNESRAALILIDHRHLLQFIKEWDLPDITRINGRTCWVQYGRDRTTMHYIRPAKLGGS